MTRVLDAVEHDRAAQPVRTAVVLSPLTGPSMAPTQTRPDYPDDPGQISGLPSCPLCHTVAQTMTWDLLQGGAIWACTRCGQTWSARRLQTAAVYTKYAADRQAARTDKLVVVPAAARAA